MERFILLALACFRVARLLAIDEGPGDVFLKLRAKLGAYDYGANGRPKSSWGRMISCPYCVGVFVALGLALFDRAPLPSKGKRLIVDALAIAGAQALMQSVGRE